MDFSYAFFKMRSRHITKTTRLENLFLSELVSDIALRKRRVNRDQTNNRFNVYWLLTRRLARSCFLRLQLISFLSGFHESFYDNIHKRFKMIFQRYLCSLCHIFPSSLSFFSQFCVEFIALLWKLAEINCTSVNYQVCSIKKKFLLLAPATQEISHMQIKQINSEK